MQEAWHYKNESTGARVGPIDQDEITRLIADGRLERSTIVWNPQMTEWAKAGTTELASLFGAMPPPLPAAEIRRWALFAVAFFPLWGAILQATISLQFADPDRTFDRPTWLLFYLAGNTLLGWLDERNLERAGLQIRNAPLISALLIPVYIYISCRTYKRHAETAGWYAYSPLIIWIVAFFLGFGAKPSMFDQ